ncbi:UPF0280 family protein [Falsiphaeobacter marinintestinus]|uniref:UPF0280 family protein n=1 Tax=Falsiphaeobacter marinintestinus TaxID=1492905 RepID=UPI0011B6A064|nr:UPF0280 family protein [Phaeobacter marinintestinus]
MGVQAAYLPDGRRLHLNHGPIDLIIDAEGPGRDRALRAAHDRMVTILDELVPELPSLRTPVADHPKLNGHIALGMLAATAPFAPAFLTPMAAVAGAVADTVLAAMTAAGDLRRAYVNNGGDIAVHLSGTEIFTAAIAAGRADRVEIPAGSAVRGIATSGWRGRSQSLGIADAVTVLAKSAARADAAATMIANAVDLPGSPKVMRGKANDQRPDSDLGDRLVTVDVAALTPEEIAMALSRGRSFAETCLSRGLIAAAHLTLCGEATSVGALQEPIKEQLHA